MTVNLYCWIIVTIQVFGDWVTSVEGKCSSSGVLSESLEQALVYLLTSMCPGPGLGCSTLCCNLAQLFKPSQKQDCLPGRNPSHLSNFSAVKPHSSLSLLVFSFLKPEPKPFPAIHQTQTFIEVTYSLHMLQLQGLMKHSGVKLISPPQYQYWDWSAVSAEFLVKNNITMSMTVLLWTLWK